MSEHKLQSAVTLCFNCKQHRLCHKYLSFWLCQKRCWRRRKSIYKVAAVIAERRNR